MFTIVPDNLKKNIQSQYRKRLCVVWLLAVLIVEVSFLIFLLPACISLSEENTFLGSEISPASGNISSNVSVIAATNSELSILSSNLPYSMHQSVADLTALLGNDIILSDISYQTQTATTSAFTLQGTATNRDALVAFAKRLEDDAEFENVDLPVSSFAKDTDIDFSLSLTAIYKNQNQK